MKLLNTLVPGFEQKVTAAENTTSYCAPVSITTIYMDSDQSDFTFSCKLVQMMHVATTQAD
jgi:hypothetical protein